MQQDLHIISIHFIKRDSSVPLDNEEPLLWKINSHFYGTFINKLCYSLYPGHNWTPETLSSTGWTGPIIISFTKGTGSLQVLRRDKIG